jgi:protein-tyrosine phosphatase
VATGGIDLVVSLLTRLEIIELGLQSEAQYWANLGIHSISYPIPDRQVPTNLLTTLALIHEIETWLAGDKGVAIHCRAGVGRSALLAACVLVAQGIRVDIAFANIEQARGV